MIKRLVNSSTSNTRSGYETFRAIWSEFRGLSAATIGGGTILPFLGSLAKIGPPWPPGIVASTTLVELVTLILVFQFFHKVGRQGVGRILIRSSILLLAATVLYLALLGTFTYESPATGERWIQGFICTPEAKRLFADHCPLLRNMEIAEASYDADQLWERWSIVVVQLCVVVSWISVFILLSAVIGTFLVYQTKKNISKEVKQVKRGIR